MFDPDSLKPHFRAINSAGKRRGFRLEGVFWKALDEVTQSGGVSVAEYVSRLNEVKTGESGLSSYLRASLMQNILTQYETLRAKMERFNSRTIVAACPVPGFIISVDKKILFQNSSFLMYLQTRFTGMDSVEALSNIKLTLEAPLIGLIEEMNRDSKRPKYTGFTVGYGERRIRGRLSMVLAPDMDEPPAAIAFVSGHS
ncbi:ribbon-helix-helix domain-containing protein [Hoeflea sp. YIM 152468]|uniref:ribbon-helix-helix domain-containing protein n=1 Tax=Hoeflea sp. YIM 152468 TaxID=3031759 RepID=UPI0023DC5709|nr:ribbon-helix-helix domain-containing protein [Hoeflea sp. YIM 152468]MDF1610099.1 ribbon-helix-helix domain-containing protein [Hoeflea sp. YIM 152468]